MTSTPYPVFYSSPPAAAGAAHDGRRGRGGAPAPALAAVGRCRVYPRTCLRNSAKDGGDGGGGGCGGVDDDDDGGDGEDRYAAIVSKCIERASLLQASSSSSSSSSTGTEADTKARSKRLMKEAVAMTTDLLVNALRLDPSVVDVEVVVEDARDLVRSDGHLASCLLDGGAARVVVDGSDVEAMSSASVPRCRMVAHFDGMPDGRDATSTRAAIEAAAEFADVISVNLTANGGDGRRPKGECLGAAEAMRWMGLLDGLGGGDDGAPGDVSLVVQFAPSDVLESDVDVGAPDDAPPSSPPVQTLADVVGTVSRESKGRCVVALTDPTARELGTGYAACINTDRPDGLYATVVCSRSGEALGLVYSSKESIVAALECGRGVYYSRSRNGLWRKGDTSGNYQTLHRIDVDCDGDALRFTVTQRGAEGGAPAFCHLNTLTCWGQPRGLRHLEGTLAQRLKDAPEGSYTKRLFEDEGLLRDKLVEEAQELAEADTAGHVAEELADVMYFAMARAAKMGVGVDDAAAQLDMRARKVTRRRGDSKAFRIAAGDAILAGKAKEGKEEEGGAPGGGGPSSASS